MSKKEDLGLTVENDDNILGLEGKQCEFQKDVLEFCMKLVHHSQWKSIRKFRSGSQVEIPVSQEIEIVQKLDINGETLDYDIMNYESSKYAAARSQQFPSTYKNDIIRIYTDDVHPGYARLVQEKNGEPLQLSDLRQIKYEDKIHGPALLRDNKKRILQNPDKYSLCDAAADRATAERIPIKYFDIVYAVHSPYWPIEASEWVTRNRPNCFPSRPVIKQIVRYGCDFVQVSHKLSNRNEWRFSFSKAELFIAKSWTISQRTVYCSLWAFNKRIASRNLCSYYFKTLMFWACEEKAAQFWSHDILKQSVCELLTQMIKWIKSKFCPNYFIPSNNMMDHLINTDLYYEINALWRIFQTHKLIYRALELCERCQIIRDNYIVQIESPAWITHAFLISHRVNNGNDNYKNLFCNTITAELHYSLYVELSDIYIGLCFHEKYSRCINSSDARAYFLKSESHLSHAANLCESHERGSIKNRSLGFDSHICEYMSRDTFEFCDRMDVESRLLNGCNKHKCLIYSRLFDKHEGIHSYIYKTGENRNINIAIYSVEEIGRDFRSFGRLFTEWPGTSPTVNISWFIAKAYLANLYYASKCDVNLIIETCDDIINVSRLSSMNHRFADNTFPVVLSTQWTSIYAEEIQELLGFYSLCSYVLDAANNHSVYLGICPVMYAYFLKLCIEKVRGFSDRMIYARCINDCIDHCEVCEVDLWVHNGLFPLMQILLYRFVHSRK